MLNFQLFDVHTHAHFAAFDGETDAVIKRALDSDVWLINVGTQKDTSVRAIEVAENYSEGVYATVGLHPIHTQKSFHDAAELGDSQAAYGFTSRGEEFDFKKYKELAEHPKVVGIGECGLDYYRLEPETKARQREAFVQQIVLACEVKKPLMIHCRNAFADLISILKTIDFKLLPTPGIVHFFTGTVNDAEKLLELGFSFSFGGVITFTRDYDEQIKYIPLDRIVLETDAPYVAPVPHRGKRNEPAYIVETAKKIAELKNILLEEAASQTFANSRKMFKI